MLYNVVYLMGKHLDDHGAFHFAYAHIRPATHGTTDYEFEHGVRMLKYEVKGSLETIHSDLYADCYDVLTNEQWSNLMFELDDTVVTPNTWKYPTKADKWDTRPEIY